MNFPSTLKKKKVSATHTHRQQPVPSFSFSSPLSSFSSPPESSNITLQFGSLEGLRWPEPKGAVRRPRQRCHGRLTAKFGLPGLCLSSPLSNLSGGIFIPLGIMQSFLTLPRIGCPGQIYQPHSFFLFPATAQTRAGGCLPKGALAWRCVGKGSSDDPQAQTLFCHLPGAPLLTPRRSPSQPTARILTDRCSQWGDFFPPRTYKRIRGAGRGKPPKYWPLCSQFQGTQHHKANILTHTHRSRNALQNGLDLGK